MYDLITTYYKLLYIALIPYLAPVTALLKSAINSAGILKTMSNHNNNYY